MLALYRCGRQADALAAYRDTHRRLVEDFGIQPGPALRDLQRAILAHDHDLQYSGNAGRHLQTAEIETDDRIGDRARPGRRGAARRPAIFAAALFAVALCGVVLFALAAGHGAAADRALVADGAGAIDPASGRTVAAVATGSAPAAVAAAGGDVWVANAGDGTVSRLDARTATEIGSPTPVGKDPVSYTHLTLPTILRV